MMESTNAIQEDIETGPKEVVGAVMKSNPECCLKLCFSLIFIAICSPFIICDLYYAYTDDSCVHNPTKHLSIGLYDYLMVSGYFGVAMCAVYIISMLSLTTSEDTNKCILMITTAISYLYTMFSISWVIVGAVIFWSEIDNSTCSKSTYSYVMASIIIRLIGIFVVVCANSKDGNK
jgi:hypothetical protein